MNLVRYTYPFAMHGGAFDDGGFTGSFYFDNSYGGCDIGYGSRLFCII